MVPRSRETILLAAAAVLFVVMMVTTNIDDPGPSRPAAAPGVAPRLRLPRIHDQAVRGTPYRLRRMTGVTVAEPLTSGEIASVRRGLVAAQRYTRRTLGVAVTRPTVVWLMEFPVCGHQPTTPDEGALTVGHTICMLLRNPRYPRDAALSRQLAAHESMHVLQAELGCLASGRRRAPAWFIEGMAEDLAWRTLLPAAGNAALQSGARLWIHPGAPRRALRANEDTARALNYGQAESAVLDLEGGHPERLVSFCRSVGRGTSWRRAFHDTFGTSVGTFYTRFGRRHPAFGGPSRAER